MNKIHLEFKWTVSRGRDSYGYNICTLRADWRLAARCNGGGYDMKGTNLGNWLASEFAGRLLRLKESHMPRNSHWQSDNTRVCAGKCAELADKRLTGALVAGGYPKKELLPRLVDTCFDCPICNGRTIPSGDGKRVDDGRYFYGLRYVDPNYDPLDARLERADGTFTQKKDEGKTFRELQKAGAIVDLGIIRAWYKQTSPVPTPRHTVPTIDGACGFSSVEKIANAIGVTLEYVPVRSKNLSLYTAHVAERVTLKKAA